MYMSKEEELTIHNIEAPPELKPFWKNILRAFVKINVPIMMNSVIILRRIYNTVTKIVNELVEALNGLTNGFGTSGIMEPQMQTTLVISCSPGH